MFRLTAYEPFRLATQGGTARRNVMSCGKFLRAFRRYEMRLKKFRSAFRQAETVLKTRFCSPRHDSLTKVPCLVGWGKGGAKTGLWTIKRFQQLFTQITWFC